MDIWIDPTQHSVVIADYGDRLFTVPNPGGWQLKREIKLDATLGRARFRCAKHGVAELLGIPPTLPVELNPTAKASTAKASPKSGLRIRNGRTKFIDPAVTIAANKKALGKYKRDAIALREAVAKAKREKHEAREAGEREQDEADFQRRKYLYHLTTSVKR